MILLRIPIVLSALAALTQAQNPAAKSARVALYAGVGHELIHYEVDVGGATLVRRESLTVPDNIQYAWPHPSREFLYVAWSNGAGAGHHGVTAFRLDRKSGALSQHGKPVTLAERPVHITVDIPGTHLLAAYSDPSGLSVHTLAPDGTIGGEVKQPAPIDVGIYGHQVRVDPSNKAAILVTRGNGPAAGKPEDPGALKIFGYKDGILTNRASIAPNRGFGFQPRHLDFDPAGHWVFVSLERQNQLQVYRRMADGTMSGAPLFTRDSLTGTDRGRAGQAAGTVHVHPGGKFVYQANRAGGTVEFEGKRVFAGGVNAIAVYAVDVKTGEPRLIQNADTRGFEPRTFTLDPGARILIAGNQNPALVRDGKKISTVPASLAVFRIRDDGQLDFVRKYDIETSGGSSLFWMGFAPLP
jgi:6-phosphogluconolactonase (cycloisomerase 2 family)